MRNLYSPKTFILVLCTLFCSYTAFSQEKCGTHIRHAQKFATDTAYRNAYLQALQQTRQNIPAANAKAAGTVYKIPTVVHIIHLGEAVGTGTNISDAQILSCITSLNDAYRKKPGTTGFGNGVDTEIEFCLAQKDPVGNPSTGINRVSGTGVAGYSADGLITTGAGDNEVAVKALSKWDNTKYYNLWVVSEIDGNNAGAGVQGFAYYPGAGAAIDGAVMLYNCFGYDPDGSKGYNLKSYTNRNRTLIHEIGHGLNLSHTFQGDDSNSDGTADMCPTNTNCNTQGDQVCDTPPHQRSVSDCTSGANACDGGTPRDLFIHNYMDYSSDICQNEFTAGQAARMSAVIMTGGPRQSLSTATNLNNCGCNIPIPRFTVSTTTPCIGMPVQFIDESINFPTSWTWSFSGGTPSIATTQNPSITYGTAGSYNVTLTAIGPTGISSSTTKTGYINPIAAASLPFAENFEAGVVPPTGWTRITEDTPSGAWGTNGAKQWEVRPAAGNAGSTVGCAAINFYNYNSSGSKDYLITKPIDLTGYSVASLTFKTAYRYYGASDTDTLQVQISTDCGQTYSSAVFNMGGNTLSAVTSTANFTPSAAGDWISRTVNLNSYVGQPILIRFVGIGDYGNNLYLDDINVNGTASAPVASASVAQTTGSNPACFGSNLAFTVTPTNGGAGPTYQWKVDGGNVGTGLTTYSTSALTAGTHTVACVLTSNLPGVVGSPATSNVLTITINGTPTVSNAGSTQNVCAASTTMAANVPVTGVGSWTVVSGTATITSTTIATTTVTALGMGATVLRWTISNGVCTPSSSDVTINRTALTIANAGSNQTICASSTTLNGNTPTIGTGSWSVVSGTASITTASNPTTTITGIGFGNNVLRWTISGAPCTPSTSDVTITRTTAATLPYTQNFEGAFLPAGWGMYSADVPSAAWGTDGLKQWESRPAPGNTGSTIGCAAINCYNYSPAAGQKDYLQSNPISLAGYALATLTFKTSYRMYGAPYSDTLRVAISTDCGNTFSPAVFSKGGSQLSAVNSTAAHTPAVAGDWITQTVDLTPYAGQSILILFETTNGWGNNLYLDDVNVVGSAAPNTLTVGTITGSPFCSGTTGIAIPYSISGTYTAGNIFTAQLSDPTGSFASPTVLGTLSATTAGTLTTTAGLPATAGTGYRIRLVSSNPSVIGTDNGTNLIINTTVTPSISISTGTPSICAGTTATFTAVPTNGGGTPAYQWKVNGVNAGTNSTAFVSTFSNGQQVSCVLTSNATCASTLTATSNIVTMTVTGTVTPSVSISTGTPSICAGTTATFTAVPTNGGASPAYQWKVNGVNAGTNSTTFVSTFSNGQQVSCVLTSNATCATTLTTTSNIVTMTVTGTVTPSVSISTSTPSICTGTTATFTAVPTNGGGTPAYQWKINGVNAGTNSTTFVSTFSNGQQVSCLLTSNATCASPLTGTSNIVTMTVTGTVTPSVSISTVTPSICAGTTATFTAAPTNGGGSPAYQWKINGVNAGTNSTTFVSTFSNNDNVSCVMTSNLACASPLTGTSNIVTMTVTGTVTPSVSISTGTPSICAGTTATFTAVPTNGGASPAYQWKVNGVNAGTNSTTFVSTFSNNDNVSCVLTSNATCASPLTGTSNVVTMTVTGTVTPSVSISTSTPSICTGTTATFTAVPTNGGGTPAYQWKINGVNAGTNSTTFVSTFSNGQQVSCVLTSNATCASPLTGTSNIVTMTVTGTVTPSVSISTVTPSICAGTTATFTAAPTNGGGSPAYQWKINGVNAGTNSTTFVSTFSNNDNVSCVMTSNLACASPLTGTSNIVTMTVTGTVTPSVSISTGTPSICAGTTATFTAVPTNGGASPAYQWKVNGVNAGTNSTTFVSTFSNNDNVSCVLTSNATCASPLSGTSNVVTMTVTGTVTPSVSISTSTPSICAGSTATFTAVPTNGGTLPAYQWKINGVNAGTNSTTFVSTFSNGQQVSCVLTSNATCASPLTGTSNIVTMTVTGTVTPSVSISTGTPSICAGTTATFTAAPTNGGGSPAYQWKINGVNAGTNSTTFVSTFSNNDNVSCVMTSSLACASPLAGTSNIVTMTVNAASVAITSSPSNTSVCFNASAQFVIGATGTTGYQWQVSNGGPFSNINNGAVYNGTTTATLTINTPSGLNNNQFRCVVTGTCGSITSSPATLIVDPGTTYFADTDNDGSGNSASSVIACTQPVGYVTNSNDCDDSNNAVGALVVTFDLTTTTICNTAAAMSINTGTPAGGTYTGLGVSGTMFNPAGLLGTYVITYTVSVGSCNGNATETLTVDACAGIADADTKTMIKLFPNPAQDNLNITIDNALSTEYTLTITSVTGQKVYTDKLAVSSTSFTTSIDLKNIASGVYLVELVSDKESSINRITINR